MEIAEKVRRVLEIIENLNGELPDDTYLEKTIDGLAQILQDPMVSQDFYPKSGIEEFTFRHFNSSVGNLQFLAFRFARISCHIKTDMILDQLRGLKKWPLSSDLMDLLKCLLESQQHNNEEFLQLIWTNILARLILSSMEEKSLFWKNSAKNLISVFLCSVPRSMEALIHRISAVLTDKIGTCQVCSEAFLLYLKQTKNYIPFVPEERLSLEGKIHKKLRCNEDVESYLLRIFDNDKETSPKAWIKASRVVVPDYPQLQAKLLLLAQQDYKHISSLISINCLSLSLWNLILDQFLHAFVDNEAMHSLANPADLKVFTSCLGNAKLLAPKIAQVSDRQWEILVKMTMIPELDGTTRSLIIDLMTVLIMEEKKKMTLENLAAQLWHLTLKKDWETIDALLYCLSCKNLESNQSPSQSLLGFALVHLNHDSSFVRKASLQFLARLWEIDSNILPDSIEVKMQNMLRNDTEAIVRRQVTIFITKLQWYEMVLEATKDLDWEVKSLAFQFWQRQSEEILQKTHDFSVFQTELERKKILLGLQLIYHDYEKSLQNDCLSWLKMFKAEIFAKFPMIARDHEDLNSEFLQIVLFDLDLDAQMRDYRDFCEHHYGLSSVLDDIIQLEANQSSIDTIDCF